MYRLEYLSKRQVDSGVSALAVGGPDDFGYTFDDTVAYNWIGATTDVGLVDDDNYSSPVNIGFNFPFYGLTQTQLYISTNGLITFGSGYYWYGGENIPQPTPPNNFIAPFWEDLVVGNVFNDGNTGAIFTMQGGTAPNRYFVIEWRNVETYPGSSPFSFEAILHENGDIVFQHQSLPASYYYSTVGIENSVGDDGLEYQVGSSGLSAPKAIRFYYPTVSTARVLVSPISSGKFASPGDIAEFTITITNTGNMGTDTFDLTISSIWSLTLYASNGTTLLTDTDSDTVIDTGPIAQGGSRDIIAKFAAPGNAVVGDDNAATVTAASSLDLSKSKTADLTLAIPASFVNIFNDYDDGAMSFMTVNTDGTNTYKATSDNYSGSNMAMARLTNGSYLYAWNKFHSSGSSYTYDIEFIILGSDGSVIRPLTNLTNNSSNTVMDYAPSIAVAPNGAIGIAWYRYLYNTSTGQYNYNVYLATLDGAGGPLTGPTNITNNAIWGSGSALNIPTYYSTTTAATDDNYFIVAWEEDRRVASSTWNENIWYAAYNTAGVNVFPPTALTNDNYSWRPVLNSLSGGRVIITWLGGSNGPYYAIINGSGSVFKSITPLNSGVSNYSADAVLLPNGKTAVAWATNTGVKFSILNASYDVEGGPFSANSPYSAYGGNLSVTTDSSSHVIMTWEDRSSSQSLLYALGDGTGAFVTPPMYLRSSSNYFIRTSANGQGNAPYPKFSDVPVNYWAGSWIERLANAGITGGCGTGIYCPEDSVTRAQMAVFLERGVHYPTTFTAPNVTPTFSDTVGHWAEDWIEALKNDGITAGCATGLYCPENPVTRAQMAVFLLKAKHGSSYTPPLVGTSTGFGDVPVGYWADKWIKQLVVEGITAGCGGGNYCPESPVTRAQMAVFLVKTFGLP